MAEQGKLTAAREAVHFFGMGLFSEGSLCRSTDGPFAWPISPYLEMGAYEALWDQQGTTFKRLARLFAESPDRLPSDFVSSEDAAEYAAKVSNHFAQCGVQSFGVMINGGANYPPQLRDAAHPVELLYYSGHLELAWERSVAVVGTRKATREGLARARKLSRALVSDGYTVASGLAAGVDTAAHEAGISAGGKTIAVIGTPLSATYPKSNEGLQRRIARDHLLISQVPVQRYRQRDYRWNRAFFPERNATMSALTVATVIVEAGKSSGALRQARQALQQGRLLFVLESCFRRGLEWPTELQAQGAIRVSDYDDIKRELPSPTD